MLLNKLLKTTSGGFIKFNKTNTIDSNGIYSIRAFNFIRTTQPFVPIYPGDSVVVLPPWKNAKLNRFARKIADNYLQKQSQLQYGYVRRIFRKKGLAIVTGVNKKEKYTTPYDPELIKKVDSGKIDEVERKYTYEPVSLDRLRLVNPLNNKEKIAVKFIKDEAGQKIRINTKTKEELPIIKKHRTYEERAQKREEGPKDTSNEMRLLKTYKGENFEQIALAFIKKIKHKEAVESKLILRD